MKHQTDKEAVRLYFAKAEYKYLTDCYIAYMPYFSTLTDKDSYSCKFDFESVKEIIFLYIVRIINPF